MIVCASLSIYNGEFRPNQRLVGSELAAKYDTSRSAVREGLAQLETEGLVLRPRNRSALVRLVSPAEAVEITEVRAVIEGLCAAKAAAVATEADHAELRSLAAHMADAVRRGDMLADSRISDLMHAKIREIGEQGTANRILERLRHQDVRYQFHVSLLPGRLVKGADEHYDIIEAVIAGDPVMAGQITRDHFLSVIAALRELEEVRLGTPASHYDHGQSRSMPRLAATRVLGAVPASLPFDSTPRRRDRSSANRRFQAGGGTYGTHRE